MKLLGVQPGEYLKRTAVLFNAPAQKDASPSFGSVVDLIDRANTIEPVRFDGDKAKTVRSLVLNPLVPEIVVD